MPRWFMRHPSVVLPDRASEYSRRFGPHPRPNPFSKYSKQLQLSTSSRQVDYNSGFNHRSHSVPGGPYVAFDHDGTTFASVVLDGTRSHTHYFNPETSEFGKVISYDWAEIANDGSGRVIRKLCTTAVCPRLFFALGEHLIRLVVTDSTGDTNAGTTTVTIVKGDKVGVHYLYYDGVILPDVYDRKNQVKASWSTTEPKINKWHKVSFPAYINKETLSIRLFGQLEITQSGSYGLQFDCGIASCSLALNDVILYSKQVGRRTVTRNLTAGEAYSFLLTWRLTEPTTDGQVRAVMRWKTPGATDFVVVPESALGHRPGSIQPVVHALQPQEIKPDSTLVITGSGFVRRSRIIIGGRDCKGLKYFSIFKISCEIDSAPGTVQPVVVITPYGGVSNLRYLTIKSSLAQLPSPPPPTPGGTDRNAGADPGKRIEYEQRVSFSEMLLQQNGQPWRLNQPTSVVRGPDNRYYFGRRDGSIVTTEIVGNQVSVICTSPKFTNRAILGLAFNPWDTNFKMYATSSILDFKKRGLSVQSSWNNGEIITFRKLPNGCVQKSGTVISGIPVSAFDHAVNKLIFDDDGVLYFSVGSNTNAGIPSQLTQDLEDSRLSGAILRAPVMDPNFKGKIVWANAQRPGTAVKTGGSTTVHATGVRNSYGLLYHTDGRMYATDNGGNQAYGPRSTGCNSQGQSSHEVDKLLLVQKGGFYGSANRARGGRECVHHSAARTNDKSPPEGNYDKYIAVTEAATTGIQEYTANTFGGTLRGNLMLSQIAPGNSNGRLYRVKLNAQGKVDVLFTLNRWSGADIAITGEGDMIMPRVYRSNVAVLKANEKDPGMIVVTSVWPHRGRKAGGNKVFVTGWGFGEVTKVYFAGVECKNVVVLSGRSLSCVTPPGKGKVRVIAKTGARVSGSNSFEFKYMNI